MTKSKLTKRRMAAYSKGWEAGLTVSPFPAVRALRNIVAMRDNEDADIDDILLIADTALAMQGEQARMNIDHIARSIARAACELDTVPYPENDDTISITIQDLEAVAHRHVTASVECFEIVAPEMATYAAAPAETLKALADAYEKYLDAVQLYNERVAILKTKAPGTMRVDEEYKNIFVTRRAFDKIAVDIATGTLTAQEQDVSGFKLVPIEPSEKMIAAAKSTTSAVLTRSHATEIYSAMLDAAPAKREAGE